MLKICRVKKKYTGTEIFDEINLDIPGNSIVTITGKNGIGKTTLLNILGGISDFEGDILLDKVSLKHNFEDYLKMTTLIPNEPFLYDYLTVLEMIDLVTSLSESDEIVSENFKNKMIPDLELTAFKSILIKNLSLGTKQKVSFITAFLNNPKLILIDEPFVNFDRTSMSTILTFIYEYVLKNKAIIIFSTHSEDEKLSNIVTHNIHIHGSKEIYLSKVG